MNYKQMQDSVLEARFNEGLRSESREWLNQKFGLIWVLADWPFKKSGALVTCAVTDGVVALPPVFRRSLYIEDGDGGEIQWADPIDFHRGAKGYSVLDDGTMVVSGAVGEVRMRYEKKLYHWNEVGEDVPGVLTYDGDTPPYDEEFHYYLVQGAIALGLKRENDPTWVALEDDFNGGMIAMREELLPPNNPENRQYGALSWS